MAPRYCVVVGDVIGSRTVADRDALRVSLEAGVQAANDAVDDRLVAPFAILKGVDEVAGVLADPAGVDRALWRLAEALHPTEIRFAVVWGAVDVGTDAADVAAMDGPAFHEADRLLAEIGRDERHVALVVEDDGGQGDEKDDRQGDEMGDGRGDEAIVVDLLEALVNLLLVRKSGWTERQAELVGRYREADSMTAVAEAEGVTVQVVSKTLARADATAVLRTERAIARGFEYLAEQG